MNPNRLMCGNVGWVYTSKHHLGTDTECHGTHKELSLPCDQVLLRHRYRWEVVHQDGEGGQADLKKTFRKKYLYIIDQQGLPSDYWPRMSPSRQKWQGQCASHQLPKHCKRPIYTNWFLFFFNSLSPLPPSSSEAPSYLRQSHQGAKLTWNEPRLSVLKKG